MSTVAAFISAVSGSELLAVFRLEKNSVFKSTELIWFEPENLARTC
jgi:hypothetical protein